MICLHSQSVPPKMNSQPLRLHSDRKGLRPKTPAEYLPLPGTVGPCLPKPSCTTLTGQLAGNTSPSIFHSSCLKCNLEFFTFPYFSRANSCSFWKTMVSSTTSAATNQSQSQAEMIWPKGKGKNHFLRLYNTN